MAAPPVEEVVGRCVAHRDLAWYRVGGIWSPAFVLSLPGEVVGDKNEVVPDHHLGLHVADKNHHYVAIGALYDQDKRGTKFPRAMLWNEMSVDDAFARSTFKPASLKPYFRTLVDQLVAEHSQFVQEQRRDRVELCAGKIIEMWRPGGTEAYLRNVCITRVHPLANQTPVPLPPVRLSTNCWSQLRDYKSFPDALPGDDASQTYRQPLLLQHHPSPDRNHQVCVTALNNALTPIHQYWYVHPATWLCL